MRFLTEIALYFGIGTRLAIVALERYLELRGGGPIHVGSDDLE